MKPAPQYDVRRSASHPSARPPGVLAALVLLTALTGCGGGPPQLMPTPNLYAFGERDPFPDVPPELQNNRAEVLYITDRAPEKESTPEKPVYGFARSRSVAFGVAEVDFGKDVPWDELVKASRSSQRSVDLAMSVAKTTELIRFPQTPRALAELPEPGYIAATQHAATMHSATTPATAPAPAAATQGVMTLREELDFDYRTALAELSARLAKTPTKEVYVFVHGYNNNFYDSVTTIAGLWHFLGRQGVPIAYSWPAGRGGLRGYTYDRESGEFTVYHLKTMLRVIAACPDVQKVNLIAHSRGTDVALTALRELRLEIGGSNRDGGLRTREALKLGTLVLAAPDLDLDVVIQRMVTARLGRIPERMVMYICSKDEALGIANWLFGGMLRLGKLRADVFTPEELSRLRQTKTVQIVDAQIKNAGAFGHDYFHSSPAVSSDLILVMRYHALPGPETGRPLGATDTGFWRIDDQYPEKPRSQAATAPIAGQ